MQRISSHRVFARAAILAVAVVVSALALAACGGSSSSSTTTAAHKHHKSPANKRSTTSATATTSSTSPATATQTTTQTTTATQTTPATTATQTSGNGGGGAAVSPGQTGPQQTTPNHSCTSGPDCNPNGTPNLPGSSSPVNGKCPPGTSYLPPQDNGPALCVPSGTATAGGKSGGAAGTTPSQ